MPARRSLLRWGGAALAAPALSACGQTVGAARTTRQEPTRRGQKVTLTFWTWVPMQKTVDLWNRTHPDVQVRMQTIPQNVQGGYQKMYAALAAGNPPDLAQVEYHELPAFMLVNGLTDLSAYGADALRGRYAPWQWEQGVFGGRVHTIPQASGPMGLFYRRDLFGKFGIETPATWAEFEHAARVVKSRGNGARLCAFAPNQPTWFAAMCWQRGARWVRTQGDTWIVDMNDDRSREVAEYWERMVRDDLVIVEPDMSNAWYRQVQTGQIVAWVGPQWGDALLRGNAPGTTGKWRVAPLPQWKAGQNASANWGGSSTAVLQGSRHPREALRFAHWLNTDRRAIDRNVAAGYGWPAATGVFRGSALDRPDPFFGGQRYNDVFIASDRAIDTSWKWSPTTDADFAHLGDAFGAAMAGDATLTSSLADAQKRTVDDLLAKGLKARSAR
ncbi:extracellular solute-binding protein [Streptomyces botrytidirepellens]|uniref:Extracellular solute-binding protein n=1 Tax=Streptomyces botrytidirepellens TaxID=2486417 RepID=A0A3M8WFH5_9ACTN|nr:extracellular solute-binding protein [Streptomyces botrytidirepellens]